MELKLLCRSIVFSHGNDILNSPNMNKEKTFIQHGATTVYEHSFNVACLSLYIARKFRMKVNERSLVRGALLHDYFGYDWHVGGGHGLHGFTHARQALINAMNDFDLNVIEQDIIVRHMFPLNITPPSSKEGMLVCLADKISAVTESLKIPSLDFNRGDAEQDAVVGY